MGISEAITATIGIFHFDGFFQCTGAVLYLRDTPQSYHLHSCPLLCASSYLTLSLLDDAADRAGHLGGHLGTTAPVDTRPRYGGLVCPLRPEA